MSQNLGWLSFGILELKYWQNTLWHQAWSICFQIHVIWISWHQCMSKIMCNIHGIFMKITLSIMLDVLTTLLLSKKRSISYSQEVPASFAVPDAVIALLVWESRQYWLKQWHEFGLVCATSDRCLFVLLKVHTSLLIAAVVVKRWSWSTFLYEMQPEHCAERESNKVK